MMRQLVGFTVAAAFGAGVSILLLGQSLLQSTPSLLLATHAFVVPFFTAHRNDAPQGAVAGALVGASLIPVLSIYADTSGGKIFGLLFAALAFVAALAGAYLGRWLHRR